MKKNVEAQLRIIETLLKDPSFSLSVAKAQDAAYYTGIGEPVPPFLPAEQENAVVTKSIREQRIAAGLSAFYAVDCCVDLLCFQENHTPVSLLEKIVLGDAGSGAMLLLNRFAHATWMAAQPFLRADCFIDPYFTLASFLPESQLIKLNGQVQTAAAKLLAALSEVTTGDTNIQMQKIRSLLQSESFAGEMAAAIDARYSEEELASRTVSPRHDTAIIQQPATEQKMAANLAGFYALVCGVDYLATIRQVPPFDVLRSIINGSTSNEDKNLFARLANATWKAGQPFIDISRVTRPTFTPFYFLQEDDIAKDQVQVQSAARQLLAACE